MASQNPQRQEHFQGPNSQGLNFRGRGRGRIGVDFPFDSSAQMGTGAYCESMVRALATASNQLKIFLMTSNTDKKVFDDLANVEYVKLPKVDALQEGTRQVAIPAKAIELQLDVLFAPATLLPMIKVCPMVATVHDLTFLEHPDYYAPGLQTYLAKWLKPSIEMADHVVAISKPTRQTLVNDLNISADDITVIEQPVREVFKHPFGEEAVDEILGQLGIKRPYFFHVSNLAPHKNLEFFLKVFEGFLKTKEANGHTFVFAGGVNAPNQPPDLFRIAANLEIKNRVHYAGRLTDDHLKACYQGAEAFVFPSLAEGWGLPVAEANALGTKVLASPHVPAASKQQTFDLDINTWVKALVNPEAGKKARRTVSASQAGKKLLNALMTATQNYSTRYGSKQPAAKPVAAPIDCSAPVTQVQSPTIAYCGDWYSPSGFGQAARNHYSALEEVGVTCSAHRVGKDRIIDRRLWDKPLANDGDPADVWIHHVPPDLYDLNQMGKHIGVFAWETDHLPAAPCTSTPNSRPVNWIEQLNQLDEIWVPSMFLPQVMKESGVTTPVHVVRHPIDAEAYCAGARRHCGLELPDGFNATWTVFLYVGTWDPRKSPDVLISAFCKAFDGSQKALLLIKSYVTGDPDQDAAILEQWVSSHRSGTAHATAISQVFTEQQMIELYRLANVFVTASRGEGFCLPAAQAMSCGKPVMGVKATGLADLVSIPVSHQMEYIPQDVKLPGYAPDQQWAVLDPNDLMTKLRWAHQNRTEVMRLGWHARQWIETNCSMQRIGEQMSKRAGEVWEVTEMRSCK